MADIAPGGTTVAVVAVLGFRCVVTVQGLSALFLFVLVGIAPLGIDRLEKAEVGSVSEF